MSSPPAPNECSKNDVLLASLCYNRTNIKTLVASWNLFCVTAEHSRPIIVVHKLFQAHLFKCCVSVSLFCTSSFHQLLTGFSTSPRWLLHISTLATPHLHGDCSKLAWIVFDMPTTAAAPHSARMLLRIITTRSKFDGEKERWYQGIFRQQHYHWRRGQSRYVGDVTRARLSIPHVIDLNVTMWTYELSTRITAHVLASTTHPINGNL